MYYLCLRGYIDVFYYPGFNNVQYKINSLGMFTIDSLHTILVQI